VSEALEVVKQFGALMIQDLPKGDAESSPEERLQQILDMLDAEVSIPVPAALPYGGEHRGHEGFLEMGQGFAQTWNIVDGGVGGYADLGDGRVLAFYNPVFESRATGRSVSFKQVEVLTVRDGKIVELVPYCFDTAELVKTFTP
jgi:uncharacterized protein